MGKKRPTRSSNPKQIQPTHGNAVNRAAGERLNEISDGRDSERSSMNEESAMGRIAKLFAAMICDHIEKGDR
jgi:hypothetical protein